MRQEDANRDRLAAQIAARQHGVITLRQLRDVGIPPSSVQRRVATGRLFRIFRSVYAVGHPGQSQEGRWMAAVLACGNGAALSHKSAAALWRLLPSMPGPIDVLVLGDSGRRRRQGIRLHRSSSLQSVDVTRRLGIAVSTPVRTIADLRRVGTPEQVRQAIRQAEILGLDVGPGGHDRTRSELEARSLHLCRRHRLPPPQVNVRIGRFVVDFLWPHQRLIVEADGYRYHRGRQAFEDDRARDLELQRRGFRVVHVTHRQVSRDPGGVAASLWALL